LSTKNNKTSHDLLKKENEEKKKKLAAKIEEMEAQNKIKEKELKLKQAELTKQMLLIQQEKERTKKGTDLQSAIRDKTLQEKRRN